MRISTSIVSAYVALALKTLLPYLSILCAQKITAKAVGVPERGFKYDKGPVFALPSLSLFDMR